MNNIVSPFCEKCLIFIFVVSGLIEQLQTTANSEVPESYLVFSHELGLKSLNLTSLETENLYSHGHHIFDIDVFWNESVPQLYWSEYDKGCIYSAQLEGNGLTNIQMVVSYGIAKGSVEGIALDWIGHNLYWVESSYGWIEMISLEKRWRTVVITNIESPRAIALDPSEGLLFWTNWYSKNPRIERSTMSGNNRTTIVSIGEIANGGFPNGLAVDYKTKNIFWIDAKSDSIYSSDYNGNYVQSHLFDHNAIQSPFGLAVFNEDVFWVDAKLNTVNKVSVHNISSVEVLYRTYHSLYGIAILHPSLAEKSKNPCENNFGCSHLCVLDIDNSAVCKCPAHLMVIGEDGKTCEEADNLLLVSEFHSEGSNGFDVIFGLSLNNSLNPITLPIVPPTHTEIVGLELDASARFVYWADGNSNAIWRASVANSVVEKVFSLGYNKVTGFGADWLNGIIYYSIIGLQQGIHSCSLISYNCTWIVKTSSEPHSLKLHFNLRKLFWVEIGNGTRVINSAFYNGTDHAIIFEENSHNGSEAVHGLTVDPYDNSLYWISSEANSIMKLLSSGELVMFTPKHLKHTLINAIIVEDGHILASDKFGHIYALDKLTGDFLNIVYNSSGTISMLQPVKLSSLSQGLHNPCSVNNGGCDDRCRVSSSNTVICLETTSSHSDVSDEFTDAGVNDFHKLTRENTSCQIPCYNSGLCILNEAGESSCLCQLGFRGPNCQFVSCDNYCQHGRCFMDGNGHPLCLCHAGYYGDKCQNSLCADFCLHGKCQLQNGRPKCSCNVGWMGATCRCPSHEMLNEMALINVCNFYCLNDGICIPPHHQKASPSCSCLSGYSGPRCEISVVGKAIHVTAIAVLSCLIVVSLLCAFLLSLRKQLLRSQKKFNLNENSHSGNKMNAFCQVLSPIFKLPTQSSSNLSSNKRRDDCIKLIECVDVHAEESPLTCNS